MSDDELDEILGRGPGDPDAHGYPGEDNEPTTAPLLPPRSVADILAELGNIKQLVKEMIVTINGVKSQETRLKEELMLALKESGLKSAKGDDYTASITEKPTVVIRDEKALMKWLETAPDVEAEFYIGVKKDAFRTLAQSMLDQSGEIADGTDVEIRESLAIRSNPKKGAKQ